MSYFKIPAILLFLSALQLYSNADEKHNLLIKLECKPAEKRIFDYESNTQLWGPLEENFLVKADVIVHCLGSDEKGKYGSKGLKYMVEIENLKPSVIKEKQNEITKRSRNKRGVGSWFKQAWIDVKEFFVNLFSNKNKKSENDFGFDIEKQPSNLQYKCKGSKDTNRRKRALNYDNVIYDKMFSTPFVFIQLLDGSIPEVRFGDKETDLTVKNFKRHIADAFATQLNATKQRVLEQSPIGAHYTSYSYDNSGKLEDSLQPTHNGSSLKLGSSMISLSQTKDYPIKQLSVMRDVSPEDVMEIGDGNGIVYDASQIDVSAKQMQQISEGRLTTTAGHLSLSLISPLKDLRTKRDINENSDITDYLKVRTKYSLSMSKMISKRSADDDIQKLEKLKAMESKLNLKAETLVSEWSMETSLKEKLLITKKSLKELLEGNTNSDQLVKYLSDSKNSIYDSLLKALSLEILLNEDTTDSSITNLLQKVTEKKINEVCGQKLSLKRKECFDLLIILIKSQSNIAQKLLMMSLRDQNSIEDKNEILKIVVQLPNPQNAFINELLDIAKSQSKVNKNFEGILLLAISNSAFHSKSKPIKDKIANHFKEKLNQMKCNTNTESHLLVDTLEAIGNLGHNSTIPFSIEFGDKCIESDPIRIAAIHSCRRLLSNSEVHKWFLRLLKEPANSCVIKQEVVNTLIEDINTIEMSSRSDYRWPKIGTNEIDRVLSENLIIIKHNECLKENIIRYFERKNDEHSKAVMKKVKQLRNKRAVFDSFWTESHCKEWNPSETTKGASSDSDDTIVVSDRLRESEDIEPNFTYRKRRKCSASKRFGPNQAQALFRADIVNDISGPNDENTDYKLMAQFVIGTHFLGKDIDVGKMYVYNRKNSSRAYVNIFGNTLVDATTSDCNGAVVKPYMYSNYFPLYDFSLWIVQMTLGIKLTAQMNFDLPQFNCDNKRVAKLQTVELSPEAKIQAGGEVRGKVLVIRGGMNIGGDFNYFSNLKFEPSPEMCLSVYNGHNPMNVSIASWYQFWHPSCLEWMDRRVWSPQQLNWQINDNHRSAWIENECLLSNSSSSVKQIDP